MQNKYQSYIKIISPASADPGNLFGSGRRGEAVTGGQCLPRPSPSRDSL